MVVLTTHDSDFLRLIAKGKAPHHGILFFTRQMKVGDAVDEIERIHLIFSSDDLEGVVLFLPE